MLNQQLFLKINTPDDPYYYPTAAAAKEEQRRILSSSAINLLQSGDPTLLEESELMTGNPPEAEDSDL